MITMTCYWSYGLTLVTVGDFSGGSIIFQQKFVVQCCPQFWTTNEQHCHGLSELSRRDIN